MLVLILILISIGVLRLFVSIYNLINNNYLKAATSNLNVKVSVLIPARNEEENISNILNDLFNQSYKNIEIIVYNDFSTDRTPEILDSYKQKIKILEAQSLPEGWTGKNFACHNLAYSASGDIFIFLDSDVRISSDFIKKFAFNLMESKSEMISVFPQQLMYSLGEKLVVPIMNHILVSFLPISFVRKLKSSKFAAANGQAIAIKNDVYFKLKPHNSLRNEITEDIKMAKLIKENGLTVTLYLGNSDITCRMYKTFTSSFNGFTKNFLDFFQGNSIITILYSIFSFLGVFGFLFFRDYYFQYAIFLITLLLSKFLTALISKQFVLINILLFIPQIFISILLGIVSVFKRKTKRNIWKGRLLS